jgi:hypothetical protein
MRIVLRAKKWVHAQPKWIEVEESKRPQTFQAVGRELLGLRGEKVIIVFVAMMQLGICMVFFNFAATNLVAVEEYAPPPPLPLLLLLLVVLLQKTKTPLLPPKKT